MFIIDEPGPRICPDCQRPLLFKWDEGCYVCTYCRIAAERRLREVGSLGSVGGLSPRERLLMGLQARGATVLHESTLGKS